MAENFDTIYWRGQGAFFLALRNTDGSHNGFEYAGDMGTIEGSPSVSKTPVRENRTGQRSEVATIKGETSFPVTLNFRSVKPSHLAKALGADLIITPAGSVTGETHTAHHGKFVQLDHLDVSSVVVTGATVDVDYVEHLADGMIEIIDGSSNIADGGTMSVNYSHGSQKSLSVNPGNKTYTAFFSGMNTLNDDKAGQCTIHKLSIDLAFLGLIQEDSEASLSVGANLLLDDTRADGDQLYSWRFAD